MATYSREKDSFILSNVDSTFGMHDTPSEWYRRSEAFSTIQGYVLFARRMELCLRTALGATTDNREGSGSLIKDLAEAPSFATVKSQLNEELASLLTSSSMADCGAGTGSLLGFIEWAGLPYPKDLILIEPNDGFFAFLQQRIEGKVNTSTSARLQVITVEKNTRHDQTQHVVYVIRDAVTGRESRIQLIHAAAQDRNVPAVVTPTGLIFVGVSKYFNANEFLTLVENAQTTLGLKHGAITSFNAQGAKDVLKGRVPTLERLLYRGIKQVHQLVISGRPTLHNYYDTQDLAQYPGELQIKHNFGDAIIVTLLQK